LGVAVDASGSHISRLRLKTEHGSFTLSPAALDQTMFSTLGVPGINLNGISIDGPAGMCFKDCEPTGVVFIPFRNAGACEGTGIDIVFTVEQITGISVTVCEGGDTTATYEIYPAGA
jgi:hypothetical protein